LGASVTYAERGYQAELDARVVSAWAHGARDVMPVLPCGGGKTVIFCNMIQREQGASVVIVHRNHLVGQVSLTLARNGVRHRIVGSTATMAACVANHMAEFGRHFVDQHALAAVAGVDTLVRMNKSDPWFRNVRLVITDEGHHMLADNKWGQARAMFTEARGAAFTATAMRPDGAGLGRHADGVIDCMVEIIGMRDLIGMGYLADYRIYAPPNSLDLSDVGVSAGGDFSPPGVSKAVSKANITGDVIETYLRLARGKLGATFAINVAEATKFTEAYRAAGVSAELITADTPEAMRASIFRRYRARQVHQLVSVATLSEGTDVPAMECVSLAAPTLSWVKYVQEFCRPLRPMEGKEHALILDHVGNVERFARTRGLPDTPQTYTLDRRERAGKSAPNDAVPVRTCLNVTCLSVYERALDCCPFCGYETAPTLRSTPAQVDGVLEALDIDVLRALRREVARVDGDAYLPGGLGEFAIRAARNNHRERQAAQQTLRRTLAVWGGWQTGTLGRSHTEAQRRFFFRYGMDGLSAAALNARDALALNEKICEQLQKAGIIDVSVN
jgi:DNA repair protein RadD